MDGRIRTARLLSNIIAPLATIASVGGLFFPLYQDNALVTAAWKGNDFVTLFIVVPVLIWALYSKKNPLFSNFVWAGSLGYMFYNYVFYLFGSSLNAFFLIYVALVGLCAYALAYLIASFDLSSLPTKFNISKSTKWIAGFMLVFAIPWSLMEVSKALSFAFTGNIPADVLQTGHPTAIVYACDLTIVMPGFILGAIWLLMKKPWGYLFSTVFLFKGITYGLALIAMSIFASRSTGFLDQFTPFYGFLTFGSFVSYYFLTKNIRSEAHVKSRMD